MSTNEKKQYCIVINGKKVSVSEEVYKAYKEPLWRDHKRQKREKRCFLGTHRCMENCEECEIRKNGKDKYGEPSSIEVIVEKGLEEKTKLYTSDDIGENLYKQMLIEALYKAIDELSKENKEIILLSLDEMDTREIAEKVHMPQSTVSYREKIIIKQLRNKLKDWK
jgi:RNA polymerase sigma factor (sigma-70 family)